MHESGKKVRVIAEIGSNHNGDLSVAKNLVRRCAEAGADYVKFQTLRRDRLVAPRVWAKGKLIDNPVYESFSNLELPEAWHFELKKTADDFGIEFFSSPFYLEAVDLLEAVGVLTYKIASGDITFFPLLEKVGRTRKNVILSTGASTIEDIDQAVAVLRRAGAGNIALLHCVSNYPPAWEEMNLRAIQTLLRRYGPEVGISDHTLGNVVPLASVALGATIVEKHVTLDRGQTGPDHPFATTVEEFTDMVRQIRTLERALGDGNKAPTGAEAAKQHRIRRGTYDPVTFEPKIVGDGIWLRPQTRREDLPR